MSGATIELLIKVGGFAITLLTAVWKLSGAFTKLNDGINALNTNLTEFKKNSDTVHNECKDKLENHEGRIIVLETKTGIK